MKKEVQKWISSVEDVTMEEAVSEFFDGDWDFQAKLLIYDDKRIN